MCDETVWNPVLPHLQAVLPALAPWVADHGSADSLGAMAERILATAPDRFALAGHSMGARVALEVLRRAPQRVARIALLDTGYLPLPAGEAGEAEAAKRHALLAIARAEGTRAMGRQWVQGMVHPQRLQDAPLMAAILDMFARKDAEVFAAQIRALLARPDGTPLLQSLAAAGIPTLVACGRQDSWSPVAQHEAMHALAPGSVLEVIEEAGHMAPMERPAETAAMLARWLSA
jgi:pimeloyl-ACP methyl ester carboxylesterase